MAHNYKVFYVNYYFFYYSLQFILVHNFFKFVCLYITPILYYNEWWYNFNVQTKLLYRLGKAHIYYIIPFAGILYVYKVDSKELTIAGSLLQVIKIGKSLQSPYP